jgi:hypothetical protein
MLTEKKLKIWQVTTVILAIIIIIGLFKLTQITGGVIKGTIDKDKAAQKAIEFINTNMLSQGQKATLKDTSEEGGIYKMNIDVSGRVFQTYISKDGKYLFTSGIDLDQKIEAPTQPKQTEIPKTDKPKVQLFVMSQCPYGIQAEEPMSEILKLLKDKIDFELNFIATANSDGTFSSLHGQPEVDGDLMQVCAMKQYPDKYFDFIICLNKDSKNMDKNWEQCAKDNSLDANKLGKCWQGSEGKELLKENVKAAEENDVSGSPTLLINGANYQGQRTSEAFKQGICSGFSSQPSECSQTLTSQTATASGNC